MQTELAILDLAEVQVLGLMGGQEQLGKEDSQCKGKPEPLGVSNAQCWTVPLRESRAACRLLLSAILVPAQEASPGPDGLANGSVRVKAGAAPALFGELAFRFSGLVGVFFGLRPARKALLEGLDPAADGSRRGSEPLRRRAEILFLHDRYKCLKFVVRVSHRHSVV